MTKLSTLYLYFQFAYMLYGAFIYWCLYFTDITMAKSAKLIQQQLEKEM